MNNLKNLIESNDIDGIKNCFETNHEVIKKEDLCSFVAFIKDAEMLSAFFRTVGDKIMCCYKIHGGSILIDAIQEDKDIKIIEEILNFDEACINRMDRWGSYPLLNAIIFNRKNTITFLLEKSADINICNKNGAGALHLAEDLDVVKLLIKHGANVNAVDMRGMTPLMTALQLQSDKEIILEFLNNGANVNQRSKDEETCLHMALLHKYDEEVIDQICSKTLDYNTENSEGITPLAYALCSNPCHESYKMGFINNLVKKGFLLNSIAFIYVVMNCRIFHLIASSAKFVNTSCIDKYGNCVLHYVRDARLVDIFARGGAPINHENEKGRTPLIEAIFNDNSKVTERLLFWGADIRKLVSYFCQCKENYNFVSDEAYRVLVLYGLNVRERNSFIKRYIAGKILFAANRPVSHKWTHFFLRYIFFNNTNFKIPEDLEISETFKSESFKVKNLFNIYNREVNKMKDKRFINNLSYYEFCRKGYRVIRNQFTCETLENADYNKKIKKQFPLYSDLIFLKIQKNIKINKRKDLLNKLNNVRIFKLIERENQSHSDEALSCESDCLDFDAMFIIGSFMNDREICSLLMAATLD